MLLRKGYMIGGKEDGGGWRMGDGGWGWKGEGSEAQTNDGKCRKARKGPVINRLSHTHRGRPTLGQGPTEAEAYWMVYSGFWLHEEGETERSRFASLTCHGSCWVASWAKEVVGNHKGKQLSNSQGIGEPPERRAHRTLETEGEGREGERWVRDEGIRGSRDSVRGGIGRVWGTGARRGRGRGRGRRSHRS